MHSILAAAPDGSLYKLYNFLSFDSLKTAFTPVFRDTAQVMALLGAGLVAWGIVMTLGEIRKGGDAIGKLAVKVVVLVMIGLVATSEPTRDFMPNLFDNAAKALGGSTPNDVAMKCGKLVDAFGATESKLDADKLDAANSAQAKWYDLSGRVQGSMLRWARETIGKIVAGVAAILVWIGVAIGLLVISLAKFGYHMGWVLMPMMVGFFALERMASLGMRYVQGMAALASVNFILAVLHLGTEVLLRLIGEQLSVALGSTRPLAAFSAVINNGTITSADRTEVLGKIVLAPFIAQAVVIILVLLLVLWVLGVSILGFNVGRNLFVGGEFGADNLARGAAAALISGVGNKLQLAARDSAEAMSSDAPGNTPATERRSSTQRQGVSPPEGGQANDENANESDEAPTRQQAATAGVRALNAASRIRAAGGARQEQFEHARAAAEAYPGVSAAQATALATAAVNAQEEDAPAAIPGLRDEGAPGNGQDGRPGRPAGGGENGQNDGRSGEARGAVALATAGAGLTRLGKLIGSSDTGSGLSVSNGIKEEGRDLVRRARAEQAQIAQASLQRRAADRSDARASDQLQVSRDSLNAMRRLLEAQQSSRTYTWTHSNG